MLKITMCAAGQKFPTHLLDACIEANQSESTNYYGYDKKYYIEQTGTEIFDPRTWSPH